MNKYITPEELSKRIGITKSTLASWRSLSKGPSFYKFGRHVVYDEADIEEWMKAARREIF